MKGFVTWGCHLILSVLRWLNEFQVEVYTPYGAVSTRGTMIFLPGLLELYMYGKIYGHYAPRLTLACAGSMASRKASSLWLWIWT